uniref:Putative salivary protease inhibitor n=1 Tax=Culicoides nubeculosus TaxID=144565 RepID=B9URI2_CULNU|nr:putative salivary protease inhibitor [Culicoides nubeculosus]
MKTLIIWAFFLVTVSYAALIQPYEYPCLEVRDTVRKCGKAKVQWSYVRSKNKCIETFDNTCHGYNRFPSRNRCVNECIRDRPKMMANDILRKLRYREAIEYYDNYYYDNLDMEQDRSDFDESFEDSDEEYYYYD